MGKFEGNSGSEIMDIPVLTTNADLLVLQEWLDQSEVDVEMKSMERNKWENLKGNYFVGPKSGKFILYLPTKRNSDGVNVIDLRVSELPGMIKKMNQLTYGKSLPEISGFKEIGSSILGVIQYLNEKYQTSSGKEKREIHNAIRKYGRLYSKHFYETPENKFIRLTYTEKDRYKKQENEHANNERNSVYLRLKGLEKSSDEVMLKQEKKIQKKYLDNNPYLSNAEIVMTEVFKEKLMEGIMVYGAKKVVENLNAPTLDRLKNNKKQDDILEYLGDENILLSNDIRKLLDGLNTSKLIDELSSAELLYKKDNDIDKYSYKRYQVLKKITSLLFQYGGINTNEENEDYSGSPEDISKGKYMCVSKSLLSYAILLRLILNKLGFESKLLMIPGHSALKVTLENGKEIYLDTLNTPYAIDISDMDKKNPGKENGIYTKYLDDFFEGRFGYMYEMDTEKGLTAQLLVNLGSKHSTEGTKLINNYPRKKWIHHFSKSINLITKALRIFPEYPEAWINLSYTYYQLGNKKMALFCANKALKYDPNLSHGFKAKFFIHLEEGNIEAIRDFIDFIGSKW